MANLKRSGTVLLASRIVVTALLLLAALPVFYLGFLEVWALFRAGNVSLPLFWTGPTALVTLNALGTVMSFRHVPLFLAALVVFYLGWAFAIFGLLDLPSFSIFWAGIMFIAITGVNAFLLFRRFYQMGLDLKMQLKIATQALLFLVVFYIALLGWSHPYGPDNLRVASVFWLVALLIAGSNVCWIILDKSYLTECPLQDLVEPRWMFHRNKVCRRTRTGNVAETLDP